MELVQYLLKVLVYIALTCCGLFNSEGYAFFNSNYHLCPLTPNCKTVKEMLIFVFLATYNSRIVCKLKLHTHVETKIEKERTKTVALKYSPSDRDVGGLEIGSDN